MPQADPDRKPRKKKSTSGVKIGTAIKITRKNGKTKTRVRGGGTNRRLY